MQQKIYLAEYSVSQGCFHLHTKSDRIEAERRAQEKMGHPSDYQVLGEFGNYQEALQFIERNRENIKRHGFYVDDRGHETPLSNQKTAIQL
jgi:hypothetical protein